MGQKVSLINRLINKLKRYSYKKIFIANGNISCKKRDITVLGPVYFYGAPKILIKGKCVIYANTYFNGDGEIQIGDNFSLGSGSTIYSSRKGGIYFGNNVMISTNCHFVDCDHGMIDNGIPMREQKCSFGKIVIEDDVWFGDNCTILKGTTIGNGCVIGAKTLVKNMNIPNNAVVIGNPSKIVKYRKNE